MSKGWTHLVYLALLPSLWVLAQWMGEKTRAFFTRNSTKAPRKNGEDKPSK